MARRFVLLTALSFLAGCVPLGPGTVEEPTLYVLTPMERDGRTEPGPSPSIGVGPVSIPGHLNRPQMVSRTAEHTLRLAELSQWAEPLDENVGRVVTENLSFLLDSDRVYRFPWEPGLPVEVQVVIDVVRMDWGPDDRARVEARWTLRRAGGRDLLTRSVTRVESPLSRPGPQEAAAVLSRGMETLCRDIAAAVRGL